MTSWVALLRGVNVNGNTIRNADLGTVFAGLGFTSVTTVLASGNVRFDTDGGSADEERQRVAQTIERALSDRFAYEAWIVLVTIDELRSVVEAFPFDAGDGSRQPYVVFSSDRAVLAELTDLAGGLDPAEDPVRAGVDVLYWNPEKGRTVDTAFGKTLGKARWKTATTTRNLRTLARILTAA